MKYTDDQLLRETQLLIARHVHLTNMALGDNAAKQALEADSKVGDWPHPDELVMVPDLPIWHLVRSVEAFVREADDLREQGDLERLQALVRSVFNDDYLIQLMAERDADPRPNGPAGAFGLGAGEQSVGHLYSGILARLVDSALIRQKIDRDAPLTVQELSTISEVKESTIVTNIHRGNLESFEEGSRRYLRPSAISKWLVANGYVPTRKRGGDRALTLSDDFEYVVVPLAGDDTPFDPSQTHGGAYWIVLGDERHPHQDYREALRRLCSADVPRWVSTSGQIYVGLRFGRIRIPKAAPDNLGMIE